MPLPLCVLPGILGTEESVAPGGGAENRRDGRMISAPANYRDPAPGGLTLCAPTERRGTGTGAECCRPADVRLPGLGRFVGAAISRPRAHTVRPYGRMGTGTVGGLSCHPTDVRLPGLSRL